MKDSIFQQFILANTSFIVSLGIWRFTHWLVPVSSFFYAGLAISIFISLFSIWLYWDAFRDFVGFQLRIRNVLAQAIAKKDKRNAHY